MKEFTFTQSREGRVQWEVQAQQAHMFDAEHRVKLRAVQVTLYGHRGWQLRLRGEEGTIDTRSRDFVLKNAGQPLAIELEGGYTIFTKSLGWTDSRREVHTDDDVTIVGNGMMLNGRGLVGRLDDDEFRVEHDVHVTISS